MSNIRTYRANQTMQMISVPLHSTTNNYHLDNNREVVDAKGVVQQFTIYEFDFAPYQADKQKAVKGVTTVQIHDKQDLVATPIPIEGADAYLLNLMSQEVRFHTLLITLCFGTK